MFCSSIFFRAELVGSSSKDATQMIQRFLTTHKYSQYREWENTFENSSPFLPPAYVVRRESNSFTLLVCSHLGGGGYPYPIMLCNIFQNAMGQTPGGRVPCQVQPGGGVPCQVRMGGVPCQGGYPGRVPPTRSGWGVPCQGYPPARVPPPAKSGWGGVPS